MVKAGVKTHCTSYSSHSGNSTPRCYETVQSFLFAMDGHMSFEQAVLLDGQKPLQPLSSHSGENLTQSFEALNFPFVNANGQHNVLSLLIFAPSLLACGILLLRALQNLPFRPRWSRSFVEEASKGQDSPGSLTPNGSPSWRLSILLTLPLFGLASEIVSIFVEAPALTPLPRALTWVCLAPRL